MQRIVGAHPCVRPRVFGRGTAGRTRLIERGDSGESPPEFIPAGSGDPARRRFGRTHGCAPTVCRRVPLRSTRPYHPPLPFRPPVNGGRPELRRSGHGPATAKKDSGGARTLRSAVVVPHSSAQYAGHVEHVPPRARGILHCVQNDSFPAAAPVLGCPEHSLPPYKTGEPLMVRPCLISAFAGESQLSISSRMPNFFKR